MKIMREIGILFFTMLICFLAACIVGISNDLVTVRLCKEYFTQGFHQERTKGSLVGELMEKISADLELIAVLWGIIATWDTGLIFGFVLYLCMRIGPRPRYGVRNILLPVFFCILAILATTAIVGIICYFLFNQFDESKIVRHLNQYCKKEFINGEFKTNLEIQRKFMLCCYIHGTIYPAGTVFGILSSLYVVYSRYKKYKTLNK
ncbi:hypothetical protein ENBRE01_1583 [Enteropsectra breve]|nr:hypothetical protein ENBRE01_1583 [Enteropsectra breve]